MTKQFHFNIERGTLHLKDGVKVYGSGTTSDPAIIEQLEALANIKTPMGQQQYVTVLDSAPQPATGEVVMPGTAKVIQPAPTPADPAPTPVVIKYPQGVSEADIQQVEKLLGEGGLTFEQANALSDDDIKAKTENVGPARIKIIRAVGAANSYPEYKAE